jgi:hypothetical protein
MTRPPNHLLFWFSATRRTSHVSCAQTTVTVAAVIENVCSSRHRKAVLVTYKTCIQTPSSFAHLVAQKPDLYKKVQSTQISWFSKPVEFPTAVTHKSLTVWSHFMDHRKAERVAYQFGIRESRVSANPKPKCEDPFCRCSVQEQNSAATSIIKIT